MMTIICIAGGLLYGLCLLLAYRQGMRDAAGEEKPVVALQVPRRLKSRPTTKEEMEAAVKQRRIDEFRG